MAISDGAPETASTLFAKAVKVQDSMGYTEPPFWYYAVEQSLGGALFEAGRLDEAEQAFKASLVRHPNSAWSLYGLMRVHEAQGRNADAAAMRALLKKASRTTEEVEPVRL